MFNEAYRGTIEEPRQPIIEPAMPGYRSVAQPITRQEAQALMPGLMDIYEKAWEKVGDTVSAIIKYRGFVHWAAYNGKLGERELAREAMAYIDPYALVSPKDLRS